jgi:signal transduction histidine kinase
MKSELREQTGQSVSPGRREKCLEKRITRLLILQQVGLLFQESLEPDRVYHILLSASTAGEGLGFNRAILFLYDPERRLLQAELAAGQLTGAEAGAVWQHIEEEELSLDDFLNPPKDSPVQYGSLNARVRGLAVPVEESSRGVIARTVLARSAQQVGPEEAERELEPQLRDILGVGEVATCPLVHGEKVLGVVLVDNRFAKRPIEDEDLQMLEILAAQAAVALTNARLYGEVEELNRQLQSKVLAAGQNLLILNRDLKARVEQLSALQRITSAMTSVVEPDAVLDLVVREAVGLMDSVAGAIHLVDEESGLLRVKTTYAQEGYTPPGETIPVGRGVIGTVAKKGDPFRCPQHEIKGSMQKLPCTMLGVPLVWEEGVVGVLSVVRERSVPYSDGDVEVLVLLANHAVSVLEQAKTYADLDRQNREIRGLNEELKRSYEELRNTQAELMRKDRLAFLGEMAGIVAHEIRNPLTSIRGFAQRIERSLEKDPKNRQYAEIIVEEVDRLKRVLNDVLDFGRRARSQPEPTDLRDVIDETLRLLAYDEDRLRVTTEMDAGLPEVHVDPEQMKQAFLNLFRNAVQAMDGEGDLTVRAYSRDGRVVVEVQDTGPGIPEEVREKMFTPFYTTKPMGTGLGLSLVKSLVEDHKGDISVESEPGEGATFRVSLPQVKE